MNFNPISFLLTSPLKAAVSNGHDVQCTKWEYFFGLFYLIVIFLFLSLVPILLLSLFSFYVLHIPFFRVDSWIINWALLDQTRHTGLDRRLIMESALTTMQFQVLFGGATMAYSMFLKFYMVWRLFILLSQRVLFSVWPRYILLCLSLGLFIGCIPNLLVEFAHTEYAVVLVFWLLFVGFIAPNPPSKGDSA